MSLKIETEFTAKLLKLLYSSDKSAIFAPALILNALAMIYAGSDGITADELAAIIGEGKTGDEIIEYYSNFMKYCKTLDDGSNWITPFVNVKEQCYKLLLSSQLFISENSTALAEWQKIMDENFESQFATVNFKNRNEATQKINSFVNTKTEGNITKIVDENDIFYDTTLFILNALCFHGFWKQPFDDPKLQTFYFNNGKSREIQMMTHTAHMEDWNLTEGDSWRCLGIPFKTYQSWLHILLPKNRNQDLKLLIDKLDYSLIHECIKKQPVGKVEATIPSFHIESDFNLEETLKQMGLKNAFKNHHGIRAMLENQNVYISKAVHKAGIKVDKYGTYGYAATGFAFRLQAYRQLQFFTADHPFIFFVTLVSEQNVENLKHILLMGSFC